MSPKFIFFPQQGTPPTYLLDTYTGAAAACSLRQLKTGVTSVVRVRRSSDNAELDFTATEVSDGTLTTWVGAGNDGFIVSRYDHSETTGAYSLATTASQTPIVTSGSLVTLNTLPSDGWDTAGSVSGFYSSPTAISYSSDIWLFAVLTAPTKGGNTQLASSSNTLTQNGAYSIFMTSAGVLIVAFREGGVRAEVQTSIVTTSQILLTVNIKAGVTGADNAVDIWVNGSPKTLSVITDGNSPSTFFTSVNSLNYRQSNTAQPSKTQEIILFSADLSSARADIETEINTYYGIY